MGGDKKSTGSDDRNIDNSECTKTSYSERYSKSIIKSDSIIIIQVINGKSKHPMPILNLTEDIIILAKEIDIIKFAYCNRFANEIAKIAKETLMYCKQKVDSND